VVEKLGQAGIDSFMRFFVTPGANHGGAEVSSVDGTTLPQGIDLLDAIDSWGDRGIAPGPLVQVAQESKPPFAVTASRPLCRYPQWPLAQSRSLSPLRRKVPRSRPMGRARLPPASNSAQILLFQHVVERDRTELLPRLITVVFVINNRGHGLEPTGLG
jgi:hypothetical protein